MTKETEVTSSKGPTENYQRARNITRGIGSLTVQNIATSILGFVFSAGLIRLLPIFQYGAYSAVASSAGVGVSFATLGLQYASAKFVASSFDSSRWSSARATMRLTLIFSLVASVVYVALAPFLSLYFMKSTQYSWLFVIGGLWLFTSATQAVLLGVLQGLKMYSLIAKMLLATRAVMIAFTFGTLYFYRNIGVGIFAWVLYYSILMVWTALIARKNRVPLVTKSANEISGASYSTIMRYSLPLGIAALMSIIASTSQFFVIGGYLDPVSLAIFNAAVTLSGVLGAVLVIPLNTALFPEIASSSEQKEQVSNGLRLAFRFLFLAVLPASLFVAAVSSQLLILYTNDGNYLAGSGALEIIAGFYIFPSMQIVLYSVLQAIGKTKQVLIVGGATAATGILASVTLVPIFGLDGAALSTSIIGLIGTVVAMYLAREYTGLLRDSTAFYSKAVFASVTPFIVLYLLSTYYFSHGLLSLIPDFAIGFLSYAALIKSLKLLSEEDRGYLVHLVPGKRAKRLLNHF